MKLASYLKAHDIAPRAFAGSIEVSLTALYRYMAGDRFPRPKVLARIERETGGVVSANDFVDQSEAA